MAESYLQHAEHYFRLIATAQQAQAQAQNGYMRPGGDMDEDEDDDDFSAVPDRFASPVERAPVQPGPQPFPNERPAYNGAERQPYNNNGGERQPYYGNDRQGGGERNNQERFNQDRQGGDRNGYNNGGGDRNNQERGDRQPFRNDRHGMNRNMRGPREPYQQRDQNQRDYQNRDPQFREQPSVGAPVPAAQRDPQPPATAEQPPYEVRREPVAEARPAFEPQTEQRRPAPVADETALPAFITAPSRLVPVPAAEPLTGAPGLDTDFPQAGSEGFAVRPRRRRRTRAEIDAESGAEAPRADAPAAK